MQHSDWEKGLQESYGVLEIFYALPTGVGTNRIFFFFFLINYFIYLFFAVLGLHCYAWAFSSWGERGLVFIVVRGLLVVASLVAEHGL